MGKGVDELLLRDYSPEIVKCLTKLGDIKLEEVLENTITAPENEGKIHSQIIDTICHTSQTFSEYAKQMGFSDD